MPDSVMLNSYLMLYHIPLYHFPLYLIPDCPLECYNRFLFSVIPDSIISDSVIPDSCFDIPDSVMPNSGIPDSSFACYNCFRYTWFPAPPPPISWNGILIRPASRFFISPFFPCTSRGRQDCEAIRPRAPRSFVVREGRGVGGGLRKVNTSIGER